MHAAWPYGDSNPTIAKQCTRWQASYSELQSQVYHKKYTKSHWDKQSFENIQAKQHNVMQHAPRLRRMSDCACRITLVKMGSISVTYDAISSNDKSSALFEVTPPLNNPVDLVATHDKKPPLSPPAAFAAAFTPVNSASLAVRNLRKLTERV